MEIRLTVVNGRHAGTEIPVEGSEFLIGRDADCQLRPGSEQVSRRHCAIVRTDEGAVIRDFNSRNGVFLNDKRVEGEHPLKTGDHIRIGPIELEVQIRTTVGGKKKSAIHSIQEAAARTVTDAKHDDLDVAEWLVHREANEHDDQDTVVIPELMAAKKSEDAEEVPDDSDEDDAGLQRRSVLFRAGHETAKPTTASSRQAAEEVLRQMFGKK